MDIELAEQMIEDLLARVVRLESVVLQLASRGQLLSPELTDIAETVSWQEAYDEAVGGI